MGYSLCMALCYTFATFGTYCVERLSYDCSIGSKFWRLPSHTTGIYKKLDDTRGVNYYVSVRQLFIQLFIISKLYLHLHKPVWKKH